MQGAQCVLVCTRRRGFSLCLFHSFLFLLSFLFFPSLSFFLESLQRRRILKKLVIPTNSFLSNEMEDE